MRRRLHVDSTVPPGHQHSSPQASQQSSQGPGASTSARMHQGDVNPPAHTHEHDTTSSTGEFSVKDVNRMLMEFLMYLGRIVLVCYPIYLMGWLGLSISWILLALLLFIMWKNNRKWKDVRMDTAVNFLENERRVIDKEYETILPAWIAFTDIEKAHWINKILQQAWPFFGMYMEKLLKESIQATVRSSSPHLKTFAFTKVHFGQKPPRITGARVYTHEVDEREVVLDLNIVYDGDVDIDAHVKAGIDAGVKGLQMEGMLRVILEPLIGQAPLVGGVTMFFIRRPTLQVNWTGVTNLLDSSAFSSLSESAILDIIASLMILPNRMCIPLIDQVKVDQMRFPLPRGVVRVRLLEARDLMAKDTYMLGLKKGKSDPYAILRVGNTHHKSKTIKENLNPRWDETYEFVVHEAPGQELEIDLFDEDTDKDDFLGSIRLDFGEVKREKQMDEWFKLDNAKTGELHLELQWLSLQTDPGLLAKTPKGCACAMLAVYLDNASNLPKDHSEFSDCDKHGKHGKEGRLTRRKNNPNSLVEFSVDEQTQHSKIVYASKDPTWEEGFTFFVHNVHNQVLNVQVKEPDKKSVLGTLTLPLTRLMNTSDLVMDQRFQLERSGANSLIKLKATLRLLKLEKAEPKPEPIPEPQAQPQPPPTQLQPAPPGRQQHPQHSPLQPQPQTTRLGHVSSSTAPGSSPPPNGLYPAYSPHRRGSAWPSDGPQTAPSSPSMRRYDSHSLLSENSIASSRMDLAQGLPYPEALRNHTGGFGHIQMTVKYAKLRNKLVMLVNSCRDLFPCSENGTDSYVRVYLLPDQTWRHRMRTQVKRRTVNPAFNERLECSVSLEEANTRKLDVSVKNNRMFHLRQRKEIGMVIIDLTGRDLVKGFTEWFELTLPELKKTI
ncbi:extended synaptotagmin-3 isoform X2 [Engraulis encrasicolus]|uniref:extended synaptotagmin-3 isoform X2 n=1 Tax=Engraulis encrasicolus TaxID=184585 RepID=UPI002FD29563